MTESKEDVALQLLDRVMQSAEAVLLKYSQPVMDATLHLIRLEGVWNVMTTLLLAVFAGVLFKAGYRLFNSVQEETVSDLEGPKIFLVCMLMCISLTTWVICFVQLVSFHMWLKVYDPKLYLLHKALDKILE